MKHLHLDILRGLEMALPPLAEQRRIVAKVDHLMALVDELEAQLVTSRAAAANLLDALVAELTGTTVNRRPATALRAAASMQPDAAVIDDQGDAETAPGNAGHQPGSEATSRAGALRPQELGDATTILVALLRERGSLSNAEAQAATGLDAATLCLHLQRLVTEGAATIAGQKRGTRYVATRIGSNP